MLNDDDALELFKKTMPSASFMQVMVTSKTMMHAAQSAMAETERSKDPRLALISLAINGGAKNFDKVIQMIDNMVALLGKEQSADDEKAEYCTASLDKAEDDKKVLDTSHDDIKKSIDDAKATVETLAKEIAELTKG